MIWSLGNGKIKREYLLIAGLMIVSVLIYSFYGLNRELLKDNAIYYYSAQQLCRGVPPYLSIFDIKTPLTSFFSAIGVSLAHLFSLNDLLMIRLTFIPIGLITIYALYRLGTLLLSSPRASVLACLTYLTFQGLTLQTVAGPRPKILMLLFEVLTILTLTRRRWFLSGVLSSLAALTWQPAIVVFVSGFIWALMQKKGRFALLKIIAGAAIPAAIIIVYFAIKGALIPFLNGSLIIHLKYFSHGISFFSRLRIMVNSLSNGFPFMALPFALGIAAGIVQALRSLKRTFKRPDNYQLPTVMVFCLFVLWSLYDFQGYPDWFPLAPFAALGFGGLLNWAVEKLSISGKNNLRYAVIPHYFFVLVLLADGLILARDARSSRGLDAQYAEIRQVLENHPAGKSVVAIDAPDFLALAHLTNPSQHIVIAAGIDRYMQATLPGGIKGWVKSLDKINPRIIVVRRPRGRLLKPMRTWIKRNRVASQYGPWKVWDQPVRNIILLSVDTLRADHLSLYGYFRKTSTNLERWFEKSTVFEQAYSPEASTTPSVLSYLTGLLPQQHGVRFLYQKVPAKLPVVSDRLRRRGYQTAAIISNMVLTKEATGLDAYFDYYDDYVDAKEPYRPVFERGARATTDAALSWLTQHRKANRPFFLWIHYMDPHGPYMPPKFKPIDFTHENKRQIDINRLKSYLRHPGVDDGNEYVDLYDEEIAYTDSEIGRLLDEYASLCAIDESLIILTADHGESMMEHETWFSHGHHVYNEVIHVPLAIRGPGYGAVRVAEPVSIQNIAQTILNASGYRLPLKEQKLVLTGTPDKRTVLSEATFRNIYSPKTKTEDIAQWRTVIRGNQKWVIGLSQANRDTAKARLYDLKADPKELKPLDRKVRRDISRLLKRLIASDNYWDKKETKIRFGHRLKAPKVAPGLDSATLDKLKALGYVEE